jgi:uncharacterized protein
LEASRSFIEKMELVAAKAFHKGGESELRKIDQFNKHFKILDEQIRIENHCGIRKNLAVMDTQARVYTCPWMVGIKDQELDLNNLSGDKSLNNTPLIEQNNCQTCWARHLCGGGCLYIHKKATGSFSKKSDKDYAGRSDQNTTVIFPVDKRFKPGDYVHVLAESCTTATLIGKIID